MAEWTRDDVRAIAPEFTAVADAVVDAWIARAEPQINPDSFGDNTVYAGALLTAHMLTRFPPQGTVIAPAPVGAVTSESVGGISISYAAPPVGKAILDASLGSTRYGIEFSRMLGLACASPTVL